jgi:hypothetical protein
LYIRIYIPDQRAAKFVFILPTGFIIGRENIEAIFFNIQYIQSIPGSDPKSSGLVLFNIIDVFMRDVELFIARPVNSKLKTIVTV